MIYLDNASTTQPKQEVINAMMPYFTDKWYNPSVLYSRGTEIKDDIEKARKTIGSFINADKDEIFFTSGGSESNCWAIQGFVNYWNNLKKVPTIITSVIEHKSIISCVDNVHANIHYIGVDKNGFIDIQTLKDILSYTKGEKVLVSIQYANNEIGTIQSIKTISKIVHEYGAVFHTDAVQAFGHIPIDVKGLGIDMMSASGHKIGTPKGIGFLYKKHNVMINPLIYGSQMDGLRGGTENVPYIIGLSKAVELCNFDNISKMINISDYIIRRFKWEFNCKFNGHYIFRLPNNISLTFPQEITSESLIYLLDMNEIYLSAGSACNAHSLKPSYVLKAIGLSDEEANRTIRITLTDDIDKNIIDYVITEIKKQINLIKNNWEALDE